MQIRLALAMTLLACVMVSHPLGAHDQFRFVATVVKMDVPKSIVTITFTEDNGKKETVPVAILATTAITRDNRKIAKSELRAGLHVVVDALGDDYDNLEAVAIKIVPPPKK